MICQKLSECISVELGCENNLSECVNGREKCIQASDSRSNIKCEANNKKYVLENTLKNHVILYKVDGGVILEDKTVAKGTCKCDFLYVVDGEVNGGVLVELKGTDVEHSLTQLIATLDGLKDSLSCIVRLYARVVVASSVPRLNASPGYVRLERTLRQKWNGNIKIAERQLSEKDADLFN